MGAVMCSGVMQHGGEDKGKLKERSLTLSDSSKCLAIFHGRRKSSRANEGAEFDLSQERRKFNRG